MSSARSLVLDRTLSEAPDTLCLVDWQPSISPLGCPEFLDRLVARGSQSRQGPGTSEQTSVWHPRRQAIQRLWDANNLDSKLEEAGIRIMARAHSE